MTFYVLMCH